MWMWILIGLNIITKANGFSHGNVPTACETMTPGHDKRDGVLYLPQTTEPPFQVDYERGENGEPITVFLQSTGNTMFMGFMLEAREQDDGSPVGKFIALDTNVRLLTCNGSAASAVTQKNNQYKSLIRVKWSPGREDLHTVTFRATFVQKYATFWEGVNITLPMRRIIIVDDFSFQRGASSLTVVHNSLNIFHIFTVTVFPQCLNKVLKILCCVLFTLIEIPALVLFALGNSTHYVTLVILVCVVIVLDLIQLVIVCLPLKQSHELYEIPDVTFKVCSVISEIATSAVIIVSVLEIEDYRFECWSLSVMIAYTLWTFLFVILFILNALINKEGSNNRKRGRQREEKKLHTPTLIVSLILIVGTVSFAVSVIVGMQLGH